MDMAYTPEELKGKLLEMYPDIKEYGLNVHLMFDNQKKAWVITFEKEGHERHAFLDEKDANDCMEGNKCVYLGMLIPQYTKVLEQEISKKK
jgi:hypothetical protein